MTRAPFAPTLLIGAVVLFVSACDVDLEPEVTLDAPALAVVAAPFVIALSATDDAGVEDVVVVWGDGTADTTSVRRAAAELELSHRYALAGPFTIEVTATDGVGQQASASAQVLVRPASVAITIADGSTMNALGVTRALAAHVLDAEGEPVPNPETAWSSDHPGLATVSNDGVVTSVAGGTARVIARSWEVADTVEIVVQQVPAWIKVTSAPDTLLVRGRDRLGAEVRDSNDVVIAGFEPTFASLTPERIAVGEGGGVEGVAEGTAAVSVAAAAVADTVSMEVVLGLLYSAPGPDSYNHLYLIDRHGTERRDLTGEAASDMGGAWSPAGDRVVFYSTRAAGGTLLFLDMEDGAITEVATGLSVAHSMAWSPDGARVAFAGRDHPFHDDIHIINVDGTGLVPVVGDTTFNDVAPAWSPDGSRIAFARTSGLAPGIYVVNTDGTNPVRIHTHGQAPIWSPDGAEIAFVAYVGEDPVSVIHRMNDDGTNVRVIGEHHVLSFDWSRDGLWFAFGTTINDQRDIFIMSAEGGELIRVTDDAAFEQDVRWR